MEIDIYIDEEKERGFLGFLVTKHSKALQDNLAAMRAKEQNYKPEIKFVGLNNTKILVALSWLNMFYHDGKTSFYYRKWDGTINQKRNKINQFILQIKKKYKTKNIVVFMDFDSQHNNIALSTQIKVNSNIPRCYQVNSKVFDMIQLCDLLLNVGINSRSLVINKIRYKKLKDRFRKKVSMKKKELKTFFLYYAIRKNVIHKKIKIKL